jgi:hypothetical protein
MKRLIFLVLCLSCVAAFAAGEDLRTLAITGLRSVAEPLFGHGESTAPRFDAFHAGMVEALPPQQRAERALELAINHTDGAAEFVVRSAQGWRNQIAPSDTLTVLITAAMNAPRLETRMAAYEIHLAAYDLDKTPEQVDRLLARLRDDPREAGPWALWTIGVLGARGVDRERVFEELKIATRVGDDSLRGWAVDALAKFGGEEIIAPLLEIAAHDRSDAVRERAYCGLAQSATLHIAERYGAIAGLLAIAEDPRTDAQGRRWSYQALREISGLYDVDEDPVAWRSALGAAKLL